VSGSCTERWPHPDASVEEVERDRREACEAMTIRAEAADRLDALRRRELERLNRLVVVLDAELCYYVVDHAGDQAALVMDKDAHDGLALAVAAGTPTPGELAEVVEPVALMVACSCATCDGVGVVEPERDRLGVVVRHDGVCRDCRGAGFDWYPDERHRGVSTVAEAVAARRPS